jgi:hypothetical protein
MMEKVRKHAAMGVAVLAVAVLAASQVVAQSGGMTPAGINADTVDYKHAVSATNKKGARAGKLVATDASGFLPSNIVKPKWALIQGVPSGFADGEDNGEYLSDIVAEPDSTLAVDGLAYVVWPCSNPAGGCTLGSVSPAMHVDFQVAPKTTSGYAYIKQVETRRNGAGLQYWILVGNAGPGDVFGYRVRVVAFVDGIAPAGSSLADLAGTGHVVKRKPR